MSSPADLDFFFERHVVVCCSESNDKFSLLSESRSGGGVQSPTPPLKKSTSAGEDMYKTWES